MTHPPTYIGFEEYSEHVPASIPSAVQQATNRFVSGRAARVAELPQWEELRQIGSDIRQHIIENMDVYLARFMVAPIFSKTPLVVMCLSVFVVDITEILNSQGAELVSSNADKYDMARCDLETVS